LKVLLVLAFEESKMAGSNKYSYYSNSALQTTTFSQDQPVNTDWFDEVTRTEHILNNISVSGSTV
jgi:hypothetical protein